MNWPLNLGLLALLVLGLLGLAVLRPRRLLTSWEEEGVGVKSGPGEVRTILLPHIISARPSNQPLMVRTFLKEEEVLKDW
jgi:hypothetical protein